MSRKSFVVAALALLICLGVGSWATAEEPPKGYPMPTFLALSHAGLKGMQQVSVLVEDLSDEDAQRTGLTKDQLETTLTAALLRSNAVTVDTDKKPGMPLMYLNVFLMPLHDTKGTVYSISLSLRQTVVVPQPSTTWLSVSMASTWQVGLVGIAPDSTVGRAVKGCIGDFVDEFAVDYAKENPKPAPAQPTEGATP